MRAISSSCLAVVGSGARNGAGAGAGWDVEGAGEEAGSSNWHRWRDGDYGSTGSTGDGGRDGRGRGMGLWHGEGGASYTSVGSRMSRKASIQRELDGS